MRIAFDSDGSAWIGTLGALQHFDGENWSSYTSPKVAVSNFWFVYALKFDSKGQLLVGGTALDWSFAQMEGSKFDILDENRPVTAIEEGNDGTIWLGLSNGIATYKNGVITKYVTDDYNFSTVRDIQSDSQGSLWIGSVDGDVFRYVTSEKTLSKWVSGIQAVKGSTVSNVRYYDLSGMPTTVNAKGIKIIKTTYLNGRTEAQKIFVK